MTTCCIISLRARSFTATGLHCVDITSKCALSPSTDCTYSLLLGCRRLILSYSTRRSGSSWRHTSYGSNGTDSRIGLVRLWTSISIATARQRLQHLKRRQLSIIRKERQKNDNVVRWHGQAQPTYTLLPQALLSPLSRRRDDVGVPTSGPLAPPRRERQASGPKGDNRDGQPPSDAH